MSTTQQPTRIYQRVNNKIYASKQKGFRLKLLLAHVNKEEKNLKIFIKDSLIDKSLQSSTEQYANMKLFFADECQTQKKIPTDPKKLLIQPMHKCANPNFTAESGFIQIQNHQVLKS